jgi:hypothetical protein
MAKKKKNHVVSIIAVDNILNTQIIIIIINTSVFGK